MGGGGGIIEDIGDFIQDEVIDPVKEVGKDVDSFVRDEIPGGWLTVGAATGAALASGALGAGAATEGAAATGAFDAGVGGIAEAMGATAPVSTATAISAGELLYPGIEVAPTSSVVPGTLQAALPELGVQTAATTAPFTAVPGSFPAATYGGLLGATGTMLPTSSLTNAFRGAQLANSLFARPQQPQVNPYQLMQQQQAGLVDYTPTLNLLAARTQRNPFSLV